MLKRKEKHNCQYESTPAKKIHITMKYVDSSENSSNLVNPAANNASSDDKRLKWDGRTDTDGRTNKRTA